MSDNAAAAASTSTKADEATKKIETSVAGIQDTVTSAPDRIRACCENVRNEIAVAVEGRVEEIKTMSRNILDEIDRFEKQCKEHSEKPENQAKLQAAVDECLADVQKFVDRAEKALKDNDENEAVECNKLVEGELAKLDEIMKKINDEHFGYRDINLVIADQPLTKDLIGKLVFNNVEVSA